MAPAHRGVWCQTETPGAAAAAARLSRGRCSAQGRAPLSPASDGRRHRRGSRRRRHGGAEREPPAGRPGRGGGCSCSPPAGECAGWRGRCGRAVPCRAGPRPRPRARSPRAARLPARLGPRPARPCAAPGLTLPGGGPGAAGPSAAAPCAGPTKAASSGREPGSARSFPSRLLLCLSCTHWAPARVWILVNSVAERNLAAPEGFSRLHQRTPSIEIRMRTQVLSPRAAVRRGSRDGH